MERCQTIQHIMGTCRMWLKVRQQPLLTVEWQHCLIKMLSYYMARSSIYRSSSYICDNMSEDVARKGDNTFNQVVAPIPIRIGGNVSNDLHLL